MPWFTSPWLILVGAVVGFGVGAIFGGGRLVKVYDWTTEWNIDAPLAEVYRIMTNPDEQARWWPSMRVAHFERAKDDPMHGTVVYSVKQASSVARLVPPFKIISVTNDVEPERRTRSVVSGDLVGVLETLFESRTDGGTRIRYHWYVRVHNPLLNFMGFFFARMFRASHDHVMTEGEAGLQRYCAAILTPTHSAS